MKNSVIAVNSARNQRINHSGAKVFISFVASNVGRALMQNHKIAGKRLFKLNASKY